MSPTYLSRNPSRFRYRLHQTRLAYDAFTLTIIHVYFSLSICGRSITRPSPAQFPSSAPPPRRLPPILYTSTFTPEARHTAHKFIGPVLYHLHRVRLNVHATHDTAPCTYSFVLCRYRTLPKTRALRCPAEQFWGTNLMILAFDPKRGSISKTKLALELSMNSPASTRSGEPCNRTQRSTGITTSTDISITLPTHVTTHYQIGQGLKLSSQTANTQPRHSVPYNIALQPTSK